MHPQNVNHTSKASTDNAIFHCSVSGCIYADGTERYFTSKKLLKQHYTKVHAEKKYLCAKCKKGFGADWMRKYHEATCGTDWSCSCGNQYTSWESLITHTRRTQHTMPAHFRQRKKKYKSSQVQQVILPLVIITCSGMPSMTQLQQTPPIQISSQLLPSMQSTVKHRKILPKSIIPVIKSYFNLSDKTSENTKRCSPSLCTIGTQTSPSCYDIGTWTSVCEDVLSSSLSPPKTYLSSNTSTTDLGMNMGLYTNSATQINEKAAAETQTSENYLLKENKSSDQSSIQRESRASQCSSRELFQKPVVRIESTHTQTTESTVVRMKKASFRRTHSSARNRRKSEVRNMDLNNSSSHLYWSSMKAVVGNTKKWKRCFPRCSSSTQTTPRTVEKTVCDSETLTDKFIPSLWQEPNNAFSPTTQTADLYQYVQTTSDSNAKKNEQTVTELSLNMINSSIQPFDQQSLSFQLENVAVDGTDNINCNSSQQLFNIETQTDLDLQNNLLDDAIVQTDLYPLLSHMQTQTALDADYYSSILANMETQTTEELLFSDLEFSDIETQTPWNDLSPFDDDSDIFFRNHDNDVTSCSELLDNDQPVSAVFQDTETQTSHQLPIIELTNSYAQTLDLNLSVF